MIQPLWAVLTGPTNKKKCQAYYSRALQWSLQFIRKPTPYWRVPLEIAVFVSACCRAYAAVVLKREPMIRYESFATGEPVAPKSHLPRHILQALNPQAAAGFPYRRAD